MALSLAPPGSPPAGRSPSGRDIPPAAPPRRRLLRALLALAAVLVVTVPFAVAWRLHNARESLSPQYTTTPADIDAQTLNTWRALGAGLPQHAAPVVLAYHDVRPDSGGNRYVVTPHQLDAQLTALRAAGYRTLTADQFVSYFQGGAVPRRSVLLTFDDGTDGLWRYADRILERHHQHATSFLISGRVGKHRPYYLSWEEVGRMARSGRWDFQDHTHDLHSRGVVGPDGRKGSFLTNRIYDPAGGELESLAHYQTRVRSDLAASLRDFTSHGLPRPRLFAYPFSDADGARPGKGPQGPGTPGSATTVYARNLLRQFFAATLTDRMSSPTPAGRRSAAQKSIQRLEVFSSTTPEALLREVVSRTPLPPSGRPLEHPGHWARVDWHHAETIGFLTGRGPYPQGGSYAYASYAPYATADWIDYTASTDIGGLNSRGPRGNLLVRVGSTSVLAVRVSRDTAQIAAAGDDVVLVRRDLLPSARHHVEVTVSGTRTVAVIDGTVRLSVQSPPGPSSRGGIGLAVSRGVRAGSWPVFADLRVTPISHTSQTSAGGHR
ncbi:polysaccharide deacetylase family protein [Streptomyces sp. NPDC048479]|uniref:polysaccharide deacetylase family protein n=1 Tax=Streptomyces sp. NPDC048479 TaxID=3154725 RepID=UPI00343B7B88